MANGELITDSFRFFLIVLHIYFSGLHHKKNNCDSSEMLTKLQSTLESYHADALFYPKSLTFISDNSAEFAFNPTPNGGWADLRDVILCETACLM